MGRALEQSGGPWAEAEAAHRAWHAGANAFDYIDDQADDFLSRAARRVASASVGRLVPGSAAACQARWAASTSAQGPPLCLEALPT